MLLNAEGILSNINNNAANIETKYIQSCKGKPKNVVVGMPKATPPLMTSNMSSVSINTFNAVYRRKGTMGAECTNFV